MFHDIGFEEMVLFDGFITVGVMKFCLQI